MRLAALLLVVACASGCGGTLILEKRDGLPMPRPEPVPAPRCPPEEIGRQEAVSIVASAAAQDRVRHTSVRYVERYQKFWKVELRGVTGDGCRARIRAKVNRWSGNVYDYRCQVDHDDHGDHDNRDDHDHDRGRRGHDDDD
jgi:hypothetical protein